jgi:hypothetical protein
VPVAAGFVHVERWDDTLLLLDDYRWFYRLRVDTGEITWQFASAAASMRPLDAAAFGPHVARVGERLLVQSITGQPYWLGTKATASLPPSRPWLQAPQVMGNVIVLAGEGGRIFANESTPPHARLWMYEAPWPTSLTGDLCCLYRKDSVLIALAPRNDGYECVRLEPTRGKALWSVPTGQLPYDLDVSSLSIGDTSLYYVRDRKLHARSLNDGSLQWTQTLSARSARWRMRYTKGYLAVYPAEASGDGSFEVDFIDPWDGRWLQRLTFQGTRGLGEVLLTPRHVVVSVGGKNFGFRSLDAE